MQTYSAAQREQIVTARRLLGEQAYLHGASCDAHKAGEAAMRRLFDAAPAALAAELFEAGHLAMDAYQHGDYERAQACGRAA